MRRQARPARERHHPIASAAIAALFALLALASLLGVFTPLDTWLEDKRFAAATRAPSGDIVFIDIDSASLSAVGVWPWPRSVHATILDRLMELGATETVFDIDFSSASTPQEDRALARSLGDAGGYAFLAAFHQRRAPEVEGDYNLPLPEFLAEAAPVAVNVGTDEHGTVRTYPYALAFGSEIVPSAGALLSGASGVPIAEFGIDFSIDAAAADRISAIELIDGSVDPARIAGKQAIIGASAVELRDLFAVPGQGILPGALIQLLAAETLKQGRALEPLPGWIGLLACFALGIIAIGARRSLSLWPAVGLALAISAAAEAAAIFAQVQFAIVADTAIVHASTAALALSLILSELVARGLRHRRAARERDTARRILDRVVTDNFDGVVVVDHSRRIVAASDAAERMIGLSLTGREVNDVLPLEMVGIVDATLASVGGETPTPRELQHKCRTGDRLLEYVARRSEVELEGATGVVACLTFRDITERRRAEDRLRYLSGHDPLTGALTRASLIEQIEAVQAEHFAIVFVDLRRFRVINDTLGHSQGDMLLQQVVNRLNSMGPDIVARLGGDSFAVLVPDADSQRLSGYCRALVQWLSFPYELADHHRAIIAASAGATTTRHSGRNAETLLSHADMALSAAKEKRGSGIALFEPAMNDRLTDSQRMDTALRTAILESHFRLAFQPQVEIATGRVRGAEALARWHDPVLGEISPGRFIPAAEETGLIVELGRWALETACRLAVSWPDDIVVSVNVSAVQFELSDVVADVRAALSKAGLPPQRLEVEITESAFVGDVTAVSQVLSDLRAMGVGIALDDFGTGYSSLSYLGTLPVDRIKIDQSFVRRLPGDSQAAAITQAVIAISRALGKSIIAEGVEDVQQGLLLDSLGCHMAQGYFYGRPMSAADLATHIAASRMGNVA